MNPILQWLQNIEPEIRRAAIGTLIIAVIFPIAMIIGSFGHVHWLLITQNIALTAALLYVLWSYKTLSIVTLCVVGIGLVAVAIMGATDTMATEDALYVAGPLRYIGAIVGTIFIVGTLILAVAAWLGTFIIVGAVAGLPGGLHFRDIPPTAKEAFEAVAIITFWLAITGALCAMLVPRIPYELTLLLLLLALVVIPGALVLAGRTSIKVAWGISVVLLVVGLVVALGFALDSLGVFEKIGWSSVVNRIDFAINTNGAVPDPIQSIMVQPGDKLTFDAVGAVTIAKTQKSIRGDSADMVPDGKGWYRYRGELIFLVGQIDATSKLTTTSILGEKIKKGVESSVSVGAYKTGYQISGEATIPNGVSGRLLVGFFDAKPDNGFVRLKIKIHRTDLKERFLAEKNPSPEKREWRIFFRVIGLIAIVGILIGGPVSAYRSPQGVFFHLPTIMLWLGMFTAVLFLGDIMFFETGPTSLWSMVTEWWKR